ncbi:MAG: hypothetical protein P8163_10325 [Candidatus Thiodiazotropha sp.]
MKDSVSSNTGNSMMSLNSMNLIFAVIMILMAADCNSEVNVKSETARLIGTLRSQVTMGSSPHEVIEILRRHGIEHSGYQNNAARIDAIVRDVVISKLGSVSIKIKFLFEEERLSSYVLEKTFIRD